MGDDGLRALLAPRSIALVGASDDPDRPPGRPLRYLRRDGWRGTVYPVNPRRPQVQGEQAWPSLDALPEVPDHVFVLTGTDTVIDMVAECGRLGVPAVTVLAGGFAEAGEAGAGRLGELRAVAADHGVRLLGPNSIGLVDTRTGLTLTANAAFDGAPPPGRVFLASQSGSMIGALVSRGKARGIGFAALVSVGSEVDVTVGELCAATLDDPGIDGYALFLETLAHADALRAFAVAASELGRPVVAYKLGRSAAGAELSMTHTGAMAGEDDVATAFLADCGIARVETFEGLLESMVLAPHVPRATTRRAPRVAVLTATGGGAAMVVDQLGVRGVEVAGPSAATLAELERAVGFDVPAARIVDLTLRGTGVAPMRAAIEVLRTCGEFDLVVQALGSSSVTQAQVATEPAVTAPLGGTPLAVFVVPEAPEALRLLADAGVAGFRTPEACADAVAALLGRRPARDVAVAPPVGDGAVRLLDEAASYGLLDQAGVARVPSVVVAHGEVVDHLPFAFPVVAKALLEGVAHKSEVGGVVLGVADAASLAAVLGDLAEQTGARRFLVQPQLDAVAEVLVGLRRDPNVGPVVLVAAGGVLAELTTARSIRMAPVDVDVAHEMLAEVPALTTLLAGYRGRPPGAVGSLAAFIASFSQLALRPEVVEAEVNPVLVSAVSAVAVDAVVRVV